MYFDKCLFHELLLYDEKNYYTVYNIRNTQNIELLFEYSIRNNNSDKITILLTVNLKKFQYSNIYLTLYLSRVTFD